MLAQDQPFDNHNGGQLQFGPDGVLYIGFGDGGSAGDPTNGQDLERCSARSLDRSASGRDRPHSIPDDNPFVGSRRARRDLRLGLRNPWRFSFDPRTGALAIGDVGQDSFEEIDYVADRRGRGTNFGWSAFEANARFNADQRAPGAIPPVLAYGRDEGCSVTGGYVVRDPRLPRLQGRYLYGDYCAGQLRSSCHRGSRVRRRPAIARSASRSPSSPPSARIRRGGSTPPRRPGPFTGSTRRVTWEPKGGPIAARRV